MIVHYNPSWTELNRTEQHIETKVINEFPFRSEHTYKRCTQMTAFKIEMNFTLMNIYLVRFKWKRKFKSKHQAMRYFYYLLFSQFLFQAIPANRSYCLGGKQPNSYLKPCARSNHSFEWRKKSHRTCDKSCKWKQCHTNDYKSSCLRLFCRSNSLSLSIFALTKCASNFRLFNDL